jgi:serine/threonine-protein kinase
MGFESGTIIGDYRIEQILGHGGMGKVYKVRGLLSDRLDAMKVLLPDLSDQPELADRFLREIKVQASLNHPNIASLYTALRIDNQLVMIMELVDGVTLEKMIQDGPIPYGDALDLLSQVLKALGYAHKRGIVHRDIKPANIMVTSNGEVKLMDFGIARLAASNDRKLTQTGFALGSLHYMSPEQIRGTKPDARSDVYSLGITFYEVVTGSRPIQGESDYSIMAAHLEHIPVNPVELNPDVPEALGAVILKSIEKVPDNRYQSAEEFLTAIGNLKSTGSFHATGAHLMSIRRLLEAERTAWAQRTPVTPREPSKPSAPLGSDSAPTEVLVTSPKKKSPTPYWVGGIAVAAFGIVALTRNHGTPATAPQSTPPAISAAPSPSTSRSAAPAANLPLKAEKPSPRPDQAAQLAPPVTKNAPSDLLQKNAVQLETPVAPLTPPPIRTASVQPASVPLPGVPAPKDPKAILQEDWDRASNSNSAVALEEFLRKHPDSPFTSQAQAKAEAIEWEAARIVKEAWALRAFRAKYPSGTHAGQAAAEIDRIEAEASTQAVRDTLSRYQSAYESRDTSAVQAVWPTLSREDLNKIDTFFKASKAAKISMQPVGDLKVSGDTAVIPCKRSLTIQMKDGARQSPPPQSVLVSLKKSGSGWVITSIQ